MKPYKIPDTNALEITPRELFYAGRQFMQLAAGLKRVRAKACDQVFLHCLSDAHGYLAIAISPYLITD